MHEQSLMTDLMKKIQSIASDQGADRIVKVRVKLGALSHISPEHFREHFVQAAMGTCAENAQLEVELLQDIHDPNAQEILLDSVDIGE